MTNKSIALPTTTKSSLPDLRYRIYHINLKGHLGEILQNSTLSSPPNNIHSSSIGSLTKVVAESGQVLDGLQSVRYLNQ